MAYDRVITELNGARLRGTSYPLVHAPIHASRSIASDVMHQPMSTLTPAQTRSNLNQSAQRPVEALDVPPIAY